MREQSICFVVDFQERLVPAICDNERLVQHTEKFLKGLSVLSVPMIVTQQYTKGLGMTVSNLLEAAKAEAFFDKTAFSCMKDEEIIKAVEGYQPKRVYVCGVEAHICVLQTALDLKKEGYEVYLVADCIGSRNTYDKEIAITRAVAEGIKVTTYESVLYELLEKAGSPEFKEISKIVK